MTSSALPPSPSILIVDDDPDILMTLLDLLEHEGYAVEVVSTGSEALARAQSKHFDAVLLEICLPDLDGRVVLQRLMEHSPTPRIILYTAHIISKTPANFPNGGPGALAFLPKPFNRTELKATIRMALATDCSILPQSSPLVH